jgi:catechol 2,3-dioxygenase-like lactoylglutathione lyase family enzyme
MTLIPPIAGRPPDQIGILVADMEEAMRRYEDVWALGGWRGFHYDPDTVPVMTYRGEPGAYRVTIAISPTTPQIELVESQQGPSIYEEWLAERGEGLHHLGFWVASLEASVAEFEAAGYEAIQTGSGYGLDGDAGYAYFDTARELGVILELIEVPRRRREPDFVYPARD